MKVSGIEFVLRDILNTVARQQDRESLDQVFNYGLKERPVPNPLQPPPFQLSFLSDSEFKTCVGVCLEVIISGKAFAEEQKKILFVKWPRSG